MKREKHSQHGMGKNLYPRTPYAVLPQTAPSVGIPVGQGWGASSLSIFDF